MSHRNNNNNNNNNWTSSRINEQDVPKSKHTIFVRGLPGDLTTDEVKDYIEDRLGRITFDFVKLTPDRSKLFVAVRFVSRDEAREFMDRYKDHDFMGHRCELTWFRDIRRFTAYQRMKEETRSSPRRRQRSDSRSPPTRKSRSRSRSHSRSRSRSRSDRSSSRASSPPRRGGRGERDASPVSSSEDSRSERSVAPVEEKPKARDIPLPAPVTVIKKEEILEKPVISYAPKEIKINLKAEPRTPESTPQQVAPAPAPAPAPKCQEYPFNKFQPITEQKMEPISAPKLSDSNLPTTSKLFGHLREFQTNLLTTIRFEEKEKNDDNLGTLKLSAENDVEEIDEEEKALLRELKLSKLSEEQILRFSIRKKKFEEAYRSDCETYAIVTRALLNKDKSLEAGLKLSFLENIDELYQKMMDRVDDFINTL